MVRGKRQRAQPIRFVNFPFYTVKQIHPDIYRDLLQFFGLYDKTVSPDFFWSTTLKIGLGICSKNNCHCPSERFGWKYSLLYFVCDLIFYKSVGARYRRVIIKRVVAALVYDSDKEAYGGLK